MSFWSSLGDDFKSAWNGAKSLAEKAALATANGVNVFASGWKDVFSGDFKQGLQNISRGIFLTLGVPPEPPVQGSQLDDILGSAALWSLQQYQSTNATVCFSAYQAQVEANFGKLGIAWSDAIEEQLREGAESSMPWIDMGC